MIARQIRPDLRRQAGQQHGLGRGHHAIDGSVADLWRTAAHRPGCPIALLAKLAVVLDQGRLTQGAVRPRRKAHHTVRHFGQAPADLGLGVLQVSAQKCNQGIHTELGDDGAHAIKGAHHGVQLDVDIFVLKLRISNRVLQKREDVAFDLVVFDDSEWAHL